MNAYRSPLLDLPGAVDAPSGYPDEGVPLHYGDPLGEQRAAEHGTVVVDRSNRDVMELTGSERLSWLEGFVSQHVSQMGDGDAAETLVLDSNGRVEHHAQLAECDGRMLVDTEPGRGAALLGYLRTMVFWADVAPVEGTFVVLTLAGAGLSGLELHAPGGTPVTLPARPGACTALPSGGVARHLPWPGAGTVDLLVPRGEVAAWFDAAVTAGARPAGTWALEALRAGDTVPVRARLGVDTDERTIPHEVPSWIGAREDSGAVHLDKGCYRGQETVARVHNLGRSPRVLQRLHLDGSGDVLPSPGDPVTAAGRPVGRLGTVVHHHTLGPIALALLKRGIPVDTELDVGSPDSPTAARLDPETAPGETAVQAGREAVRRLRGS